MCTIIVAVMLAATIRFEDVRPVSEDLPLPVGVFEQQVYRAYTTADGLPDNYVVRVFFDADGAVMAATGGGHARLDGDRWHPVTAFLVGPDALAYPSQSQMDSFLNGVGAGALIRDVVQHQGEIAIAADTGLYIGDGRNWQLALPRDGERRWAPVDVRAAAYDAEGRLWFASPQGVGYRVSETEWKLFTGADGLPFNDFTCMAAGPKGVWFGTTNGAILYTGGEGCGAWSYRQGRRWLNYNHVRHIAVDAEGRAWISGDAGVSCIAPEPMTLAKKAAFFEGEIEKYHRRTKFGYVNPAELAAPGDKSTAVPTFTDNDGHNTGLYLGAVALGFAATDNPKLRQDAVNAFRALAFLSEVTQGGTHPAPSGFIARAVMPTSEPDPNPQFDLEFDLKRNKADALWKIIQPRWPVDATGEWYWKNDSSSDELDGHFFGYAIYFDRVCETDAEKDEVRAVVRRIIDHILDHGYNLVDYDGEPTRWGRLSPDDLNRNEAWCAERGLNSLSMLTYLSIAHHITGDENYREAYLTLAIDHGYGMNTMVQPREFAGPGNFGHQPDDNMAFMNYYHLIRYETDPKLLSMFYNAIHVHWQYEKYERNAFENFIYAACCLGKIRTDHWGSTDLSPPRSCFDDAVDTLKRYPLDLVDWPMSNDHRIDLAPFRDDPGPTPGVARRVDGYAVPIDERHETRWDRDPWSLTHRGNGTTLHEGVHYLLAYYLGRAHGFIIE